MKNYILFFLLYVLSYIVPKKKKMIVCGGGDAKQFQGNPKYILLFLLKNNNSSLTYYWSSKSKKQQSKLKTLHIPFINPYSIKGFFTLLRAQYLIIEKSSYDVYYTRFIFGRFNFIQTWHGTPLKKIGIDAQGQNSTLPLSTKQNSFLYKFLTKLRFFSRQKFKLITATSPITLKIFKRTFENRRVQITGYPRNDIFFNSKLSTKNYQNELNLSTFKRTFLYAPTFRDNNSKIMPLSKTLDKYNCDLKEKNYILLIKKHPWQKDLIIPEHLSHVKDVSTLVDDIQELLVHIDVLITDFSSCFFDFMLTKKPIIYYSYDFENYLKYCRSLYLDYYEDLPGPFAKNEKELFDLIFSVEKWQNHPSYKATYQNFTNQYNVFQDGNSSSRILKILFPNHSF